MEIRSYSFSTQGQIDIENTIKGRDWPVVYMIYNDEELYIGETTSASSRINQHLQNPEKKNLRSVKIVFDDSYNKSVILDFEQRLIRYCKADGRFTKILNKNAGQSSSHEYYNRVDYSNAFRNLWPELIKEDLAKDPIEVVENKDIFKYSPYNSLTLEQDMINASIIGDICDTFTKDRKGISIVNGCAGTGKTVMAISLINTLLNIKNIDLNDISENEVLYEKIESLISLQKFVKKNGQFSIAFVLPMTGIRKTMKIVFKDFGNGLTASLVMSPSDITKKKYDIVIVDESHRLCAYRNIVNRDAYKKASARVGLDYTKDNQLDWIIKQSKYSVLFYDEDQTVKGSDITLSEMHDSLVPYDNVIRKYQLSSQMRCEGGSMYIDYIKGILNIAQQDFKHIVNYDFKMFSSVDTMVQRIRELDTKFGLCRTVAGYSWAWKTKGKKYEDIIAEGLYDIDIEGNRYIWNLENEGWILSNHAIDTIGCIHTVQGFDLNYVGIIFGKEIDYDPMKRKIIVDRQQISDANVIAKTDDDKIHTFIINTYTTMMARGIKGCYVYACNKRLRDYLSEYIILDR